MYFYKMKPTEEFILKQSHKNKEIIFYLSIVIEQELQEFELYLKYGIPYFYYKNKPFCYLAPNKKGYIDLGFARGFQLKLNQEVLVSKNRNTVKSLRYFQLNSVEDKVLRSVITECKLLY